MHPFPKRPQSAGPNPRTKAERAEVAPYLYALSWFEAWLRDVDEGAEDDLLLADNSIPTRLRTEWYETVRVGVRRYERAVRKDPDQTAFDADLIDTLTDDTFQMVAWGCVAALARKLVGIITYPSSAPDVRLCEYDQPDGWLPAATMATGVVSGQLAAYYEGTGRPENKKGKIIYHPTVFTRKALLQEYRHFMDDFQKAEKPPTGNILSALMSGQSQQKILADWRARHARETAPALLAKTDRVVLEGVLPALGL